MKPSLRISRTPIPGLLVVDLPIHIDNRGWFKEHWQRQKMVALGLPDFEPVQQNVSFNSAIGTTRGLHAEPWDKYVSVGEGRAYGAWVDLREGPGFGRSFSIEISPKRAVFVPRGVANGFQTLETNTTYTYLVNSHWSPDSKYAFLNYADPTITLEWPIPPERAVVSQKDIEHPWLTEVIPFPSPRIIVTGSSGQLGRALQAILPSKSTTFLTRDDLDLSNPSEIESFDWSGVSAIINAAALTDVDAAESDSGREKAWAINASAVESLARIANLYQITLVHISTDYVFDGRKELHCESEPYSPLGVYGQSKSAGDIAAQFAKKHYVLRTSWVVGEGKNFVNTMRNLSKGSGELSVVNDQFGRLTFATEIARAILHLLREVPVYGVYNLSNSGDIVSWYEVACAIFTHLNADADRIKPISSATYVQEQNISNKRVSPRPKNSGFSLEKISRIGFVPTDWRASLSDYLAHTKG